MTDDGHPRACVMGDMDLLRPLGLAGIPCAPVAKSGDPTAHSRFTVERIEWAHNWLEWDVLERNLLDFARKQREPPTLFYEDDGDLLFVSARRERLRPHLRFAIAEQDLVEELVRKDRFSRLAQRVGLPVPISVCLRPAEDPPAPDLSFPYPALLKPLSRRDALWKPVALGAKALVVSSREQLLDVWPRLAETGLEILAQELIPGGEDRIESYHAYVDDRGDLAGEFTGRKIRTLPLEFGHTTALAITNRSAVIELGRECMQRLGLKGVAKLDFKWAPDGSLRLLEVNPRFNLWHLPAAVAGVNLPAMVHADLVGLPRPRARLRKGVRWSKPWRDVRAAQVAGMSPASWLRWQLACETRSVASLDDPLPFLRGLVWPSVARRLRSQRSRLTP